MIHVKHPFEHCNQAQEQLVTTCPPEEKRWHELMFSLGNASYIYHMQADGFEPTRSDWEEWLDGLEESIRIPMRQKGFEGCLGVLSFTRYVNEKNDVGMDEFVRGLLGEEVYEEYKQVVGPI